MPCGYLKPVPLTLFRRVTMLILYFAQIKPNGEGAKPDLTSSEVTQDHSPAADPAQKPPTKTAKAHSAQTSGIRKFLTADPPETAALSENDPKRSKKTEVCLKELPCRSDHCAAFAQAQRQPQNAASIPRPTLFDIVLDEKVHDEAQLWLNACASTNAEMVLSECAEFRLFNSWRCLDADDVMDLAMTTDFLTQFMSKGKQNGGFGDACVDGSSFCLGDVFVVFHLATAEMLRQTEEMQEVLLFLDTTCTPALCRIYQSLLRSLTDEDETHAPTGNNSAEIDTQNAIVRYLHSKTHAGEKCGRKFPSVLALVVIAYYIPLPLFPPQAHVAILAHLVEDIVQSENFHRYMNDIVSEKSRAARSKLRKDLTAEMSRLLNNTACAGTAVSNSEASACDSNESKEPNLGDLARPPDERAESVDSSGNDLRVQAIREQLRTMDCVDAIPAVRVLRATAPGQSHQYHARVLGFDTADGRRCMFMRIDYSRRGAAASNTTFAVLALPLDASGLPIDSTSTDAGDGDGDGANGSSSDDESPAAAAAVKLLGVAASATARPALARILSGNSGGGGGGGGGGGALAGTLVEISGDAIAAAPGAVRDAYVDEALRVARDGLRAFVERLGGGGGGGGGAASSGGGAGGGRGDPDHAHGSSVSLTRRAISNLESLPEFAGGVEAAVTASLGPDAGCAVAEHAGDCVRRAGGVWNVEPAIALAWKYVRAERKRMQKDKAAEDRLDASEEAAVKAGRTTRNSGGDRLCSSSTRTSRKGSSQRKKRRLCIGRESISSASTIESDTASSTSESDRESDASEEMVSGNNDTRRTATRASAKMHSLSNSCESAAAAASARMTRSRGGIFVK
ncbi:hypothetical protein HDU83_003519 [Entophlyctis luteolus]|nr:hypothetical protein HDU83_003519 [Entophlyctis luteolus]